MRRNSIARHMGSLGIRHDLRRLTANDALLLVCMACGSWWSAAGLIRLASGG